MAKTKTKKVPEVEIKEDTRSNKLSSNAPINDSYVSLALGAVVIVAIAAVLFVFIKGNLSAPITPIDESLDVTQTETKTYTLAEGEGLWDVAVKFYGDGNRWVEIAEANNLTDNPDNVPPGTELIIPNL